MKRPETPNLYKSYTRGRKLAFHFQWESAGCRLSKDGKVWTFETEEDNWFFQIHNDYVADIQSIKRGNIWVTLTTAKAAMWLETTLQKLGVLCGTPSPRPDLPKAEHDDCPSCWGSGFVRGWGAPCQQEGCVA